MIKNFKLDLIDDNPFNPRRHYNNDQVTELATSIKRNGLIHTPTGRERGGRAQLATGGYRKRAFLWLNKASKGKEYPEMPIDIHEYTDAEMGMIALEENIKRKDIKSLDVARSIDNLIAATKVTEEDIGTKLNMTQGNVSNMRRVLKLPQKVLDKIDDGTINFTMGRELLIFLDINIGSIQKWSSKEKGYAQKPKDGEFLILDTIKCTTGQYPSEPKTVDGIIRAIARTAREHMKSVNKTADSYATQKPLFDISECHKCATCIKVYPTKTQPAYYCYNFKCWEKKQSDHIKKSAAAATRKMEEDIGTKVAAEAKNLTSTKPVIKPEVATTIPPEERDEARTRVKNIQQTTCKELCSDCLNIARCEGSEAYENDEGKMVCDNKMTKATAAEVKEKATKVPKNLTDLVKEKAGTRAEILDLRELRAGYYGLKQGYNLLDKQLQALILDPEDCIKNCTTGFHYAYDSEPRSSMVAGGNTIKDQTYFVCSNTKCLAQKKAAATRAKNAEGATRKRAELQAITKAVEQTTTLDKPRMKLIIYNLIEADKGYYGSKPTMGSQITKRLLGGGDKVGDRYINDNVQTKGMAAVDKMNDEEIAKLIVEFLLKDLTYNGDIGDYKIQTTQCLNWMGIGINIEKPKVKEVDTKPSTVNKTVKSAGKITKKVTKPVKNFNKSQETILAAEAQAEVEGTADVLKEPALPQL